MNTEAGPSASPRLPSSTATSKVRRSPVSLGLRRVTTASVTFEPSLAKAEIVALGGSLAKLPVDHSSIISVVVMWPAARTGRLANRMTEGATPSRLSVGPASLAPRALSTISASEWLRACGTPMVFCAGRVMALGGVAGAWAKTRPGTRRQATRLAKRRADMQAILGCLGDKREGER